MTTPITSPQATEQRRVLAELGREDILIVVVVIPRERQTPTLVSRNRRPTS